MLIIVKVDGSSLVCFCCFLCLFFISSICHFIYVMKSFIQQNKRPRQFGSVIIVDHSKPPEMNALSSNLAPNDRHDSVQVVSSTYSELAPDNPTTGHSNTPIAMPTEIEVVSETK